MKYNIRHRITVVLSVIKLPFRAWTSTVISGRLDQSGLRFHLFFKNVHINMQSPVLETAGRIVAKCDQTLVWAKKFFPKDRPENEFGRLNLGRGYRMFSAYLRSIS